MFTTSVTLLKRVRQRDDRAAWNRFVALYTPLLYRWARGVGLREQDAGDLVQDVLVILLKELPGFKYDRDKGNFRGWLRTIAGNKARERLRYQKVRGAGGGDLPPEIVDRATDDPFWEQEYREFLVRRAFDVMQAEFTPTTWQACRNHVLSGQPAAEVGRELGISEGAVYVAKSRVLKRLRQELEGLLD